MKVINESIKKDFFQPENAFPTKRTNPCAALQTSLVLKERDSVILMMKVEMIMYVGRIIVRGWENSILTRGTAV